MKHWYVAQTQPRKEELAKMQLANQGFATFSPTRRRVRKVGRSMRPVTEPFFPGYLFVALDLTQDSWRSVNGTIGVLRLVSFGMGRGDLPAVVPAGLVERLLDLSDEHGELHFDETLAPGDEVRVVGGPLDTMCGKLIEACDKDRVIILMDILARETRVVISRNRLVAA